MYVGGRIICIFINTYICANIFRIEFEDISGLGEEAASFLWQIPQLKCSLWDSGLETDFTEEKYHIVMELKNFSLWKTSDVHSDKRCELTQSRQVQWKLTSHYGVKGKLEKKPPKTQHEEKRGILSISCLFIMDLMWGICQQAKYFFAIK